MLNKLKVENFKCFDSLDLKLEKLNVFAGVNSMGKSTLIQSLLLLRQAYDLGAINSGLHLNGELTNIGVGYDLLYRNSNTDTIGITLTTGTHTYAWAYQYKAGSDYLPLCSEGRADTETIPLFSQEFCYISAERIGPQRYYKKSYYNVVNQDQIGAKGEWAVDYLAEHGFSKKIDNANVLHSSLDENSMLLLHAEAWLSEISPGLKLNINKDYSKAGLVGVEFDVGNSTGNISPSNVGFGLSYVLPVIVAILKASPGSLTIIENPEAHLHPRGQRLMGELIAKACAGGAQIIVETHSDHILNGIRLSAKNGIIDSLDVGLNYFTIDDTTGKHIKLSPMILNDGSLSSWPDGFFDEWDKAIDCLF